MAGAQHSPGDIQFQLVYDRDQRAETSYLNINTCQVISNISQLLPLFDTDHLEIANCFNLSIVFHLLGDFGQALFIRSCH